ncbi:MAG: hypothetical protein KQ78_00782 [Candidatus Izimaplasma bacterium HR2]|nr:MAG: hypothetical protein KQ78_00782 [Candidatus Izimaplasma bacterium HR2]
MKKVIISVAALVFLASSFLALSYFNKSDVEGTITITVIDEIGDIVSSKEFDFTSEDTLFDLLDQNFEVGCANSSYQLSSECEKILFTSRVLMKIDDVETDWINSYIAIYKNNEYSLLGIDNIVLNDGDVFVFEYKTVGGDN